VANVGASTELEIPLPHNGCECNFTLKSSQSDLNGSSGGSIICLGISSITIDSKSAEQMWVYVARTGVHWVIM